MGTYNLIQDVISLKTLNVAERLEVLDSMQGLLLAAKDSSSSGSEPGQPSVQAETGEVEALGVSEEQMTKLAYYVAIFTSATYQTRRNSQTDELAAVDAERCRIVKYMVEKSLNYKNLPLAEEQAAGKALTVELAPYDKFYERPVAERTRIIDGFLEDARKEKYAAHITTLGFDTYLAKAEELNNRYKQLAALRNTEDTATREAVYPSDLTEEVQDLVDDICALANAWSLAHPSDAATTFITETNTLFDRVRATRKRRGSQKDKSDDASKPDDKDEPTTEQPDTETPDTEQPDTEEPDTPDTETPGTGTETPEEPDDRPVVQ